VFAAATVASSAPAVAAAFALALAGAGLGGAWAAFGRLGDGAFIAEALFRAAGSVGAHVLAAVALAGGLAGWTEFLGSRGGARFAGG
jgi:hypothetical protein